jgi:hypothetical protein
VHPVLFCLCAGGPELMLMSETDTRAEFDLTKSGLRGVPIMVTLSGVYTTQATPAPKKTTFAQSRGAHQTEIDIH